MQNKKYLNLQIITINLRFMKKFPKFILNIATWSFIISLFAFGISYISKDSDNVQGYFSGIAFYGTIITVYILLFHLFLVTISFIVNLINRQDD